MSDSRLFLALCVALGAAVFALNAIPQEWFMRNESELIRVGGTALSILGAVGLWIMRAAYERGQEQKRRDARRQRLLVALRAEIHMQLDTYFEQFGPDVIEPLQTTLVARVTSAKAGEKALPIGVAPRENDIFDRVKDEIADLPQATIGPIIRYYQSDEYVVELIRAFATDRFVGVGEAQQLGLVTSYITMAQDATVLACDAIISLSLELGDVQNQQYKDAQDRKAAMLAYKNKVVKAREKRVADGAKPNAVAKKSTNTKKTARSRAAQKRQTP